MYFSSVVVFSGLFPLLHAWLKSFLFSFIVFLFSFILSFSLGLCLLVMVVSPRDSFIVLFIVSIICSYSVSQFILYHFFYFVVECVPSLLVVYFYSFCSCVWVAAFC